ncbi:MAG: TIM barrel protein [Actinomyces sp.]|jgi:inosose dehydratase|nr:TIM barrel protein [Actinomyces sp.]MCI1662604.1 TIM barrel protein [Actinomyces sp.]
MVMTVANAPVSYGVFGLARPDRVPLPSGERLLDLVRRAGYQGIDSGASGLLGTGAALVDALDARGLRLCGGWVDFPFSGTEEAFAEACERASPLLDDLALAADAQGEPFPLPTLADAGSDFRRAHPGGGPDLELDPRSWSVLVDRVERVAEEVRERGLEPTFHHHASTYVETPREIERLLNDTSVGLTLDTGHLVLGGGDPVACLSRWRGRINHVHLKDVDRSVLTGAAGSAHPIRDVWEKRVFVALGRGDLDVPGFMDELAATGYGGWVVVEQDVVMLDPGDVDRAAADQIANREALRRWIP